MQGFQTGSSDFKNYENPRFVFIFRKAPSLKARPTRRDVNRQHALHVCRYNTVPEQAHSNSRKLVSSNMSCSKKSWWTLFLRNPFREKGMVEDDMVHGAGRHVKWIGTDHVFFLFKTVCRPVNIFTSEELCYTFFSSAGIKGNVLRRQKEGSKRSILMLLSF